MIKRRTRDRIEAVGFDAVLILTGIFTLPTTASLAADAGFSGWQAGLAQSLMLFIFRASLRYTLRRFFRGFEERWWD